MPLEPGEQHLAVHVEDHPIEYAKFEGEIPQGQYGAGTVEIWDRARTSSLEEKPNGGLTVRLHGKRLDGVWALVPAHLDGKEQNWLIVRKREDAQPSDEVSLGRRYRPMLATLEKDVPARRRLAVRGEVGRLPRARVRARRRRHAPVAQGQRPDAALSSTSRRRSRRPSSRRTPCSTARSARSTSSGRASFSAMQQGGAPLVYYAFDLLELDGEPLRRPSARASGRARLDELLDRRNRTVRLSETFDDGEALLEAAQAQELEGIMAKRADSRYFEGRRTRDWLKIKTHGRQEFVIAGYTHGGGRRASTFGSLILAVYDGRRADSTSATSAPGSATRRSGDCWRS